MSPADDAQLKELLEPDALSISVEIAVHDASRFEWRVAVPLPADGRLEYSVETEFELPSNSVSTRSPWDQLQGFTRLEGPQLIASGPEAGATGGAIRQQVLALQQLLRRAREGVVRHCGLLVEPEREATMDERRSLLTWFDAAFRALTMARADVAQPKAGDSADVGRERELADEFISVRLIDFVAEAQATVDALLRPVAADVGPLRSLLESLDIRLHKALDAELEYRKSKGYPAADAASPESLERYVERGGRLKKHFESVLTLSRESYPVEERLHAWTTALGAVIAGACAFGLQLYLMNTSNTTRLSWSLIGIMVLMGGTYAMRERIKEIFRGWLTGRVYQFYAQRVVRCMSPADSGGSVVIIQAREWCHETMLTRPDPLNPESGESLRVTQVDHLHRGVIEPQPQLVKSGVRRVRQLFRYDLAPLFGRLQDPIKRIPVVDPESGRSKFIDAPRRYQMPVRVSVVCGGETRKTAAVLVLDKLGIVRLEPATAP